MKSTSVADDLATLADSLRRVTVRVHDERGRGAGSGVVWSDGLIVTNAHVVRGRHATVLDVGGRAARAIVERRDARRDLVALRVEPDQTGRLDVGVASARDSRTIRPGEVVVAFGNPLGLVGALTAGLVQRRNDTWVVADVRLAPGNSGGPLADTLGRVVGINSMVAGSLALAVPANAVAAFLDGGSRRLRLGVSLTPTEIGRDGRRFAALLVTGVQAGSRADRAGLMLGDAIVAIDAAALDSRDAPTQLARASTVEIIRAGERLTVAINVRMDIVRAA
jgi:serine protease Do